MSLLKILKKKKKIFLKKENIINIKYKIDIFNKKIFNFTGKLIKIKKKNFIKILIKNNNFVFKKNIILDSPYIVDYKLKSKI